MGEEAKPGAGPGFAALRLSSRDAVSPSAPGWGERDTRTSKDVGRVENLRLATAGVLTVHPSEVENHFLGAGEVLAATPLPSEDFNIRPFAVLEPAFPNWHFRQQPRMAGGLVGRELAGPN